MSKLLTSTFAGALLGLAVLANATPAFAGSSCHTIDADGIGQNNGDLTTDAKLYGAGILEGTTHTEFTPIGFEGTRLLFTAVTTFSTNSKASLEVQLEGYFDVATGEFHASGSDFAGTGKLAGSSGTITLDGVEDASGRFTETVTGRVCIDRGK